MQAGLVSNQLSLREVFAAASERTLLILVFIDVTMYLSGVRPQRMVAQQQMMTEATEKRRCEI